MPVANHNQLCWPALKIVLCLSLSRKVLRIRGKKVKQNLSEKCLKCTAIANAVSKFSNMFRGSMSPYPLDSFCSSICLQIILPEKSTLGEMSKFGATFLNKCLRNTPLT